MARTTDMINCQKWLYSNPMNNVLLSLSFVFFCCCCYYYIILFMIIVCRCRFAVACVVCVAKCFKKFVWRLHCHYLPIAHKCMQINFQMIYNKRFIVISWKNSNWNAQKGRLQAFSPLFTYMMCQFRFEFHFHSFWTFIYEFKW